MSKEYVEQVEGACRVAGTRVSLDSVVYAFRRGASPESIQRSFPLLTLEQLYRAIAFYLAHREEVDRYLLAGTRSSKSCAAPRAKRTRSGTRTWSGRGRRRRLPARESPLPGRRGPQQR